MRSFSRLLCLGLVCAAFIATGVWAETSSPLGADDGETGRRKMPRLPTPGMGAIVEGSPSPTLQAMQEELTRSFGLLQGQPVPPYYRSPREYRHASHGPVRGYHAQAAEWRDPQGACVRASLLRQVSRLGVPIQREVS